MCGVEITRVHYVTDIIHTSGYSFDFRVFCCRPISENGGYCTSWQLFSRPKICNLIFSFNADGSQLNWNLEMYEFFENWSARNSAARRSSPTNFLNSSIQWISVRGKLKIELFTHFWATEKLRDFSLSGIDRSANKNQNYSIRNNRKWKWNPYQPFEILT